MRRFGTGAHVLILFNKPFNVLSQFTDRSLEASRRETLSRYVPIPHVYPAGRLDRDSEGLLLLTDDGKLQAQIADPKHKMAKTYWVQVEGAPQEDALQSLRRGVRLKDGVTQPAKARLIEEPMGLWLRNPPIRVRKSVLDNWIEMVIREGKNRQIRRMTAAVGHPCLRLIRAQIGDWRLGDLMPGEYKKLTVL
ncbi:pseudouridine synthase [Planktomarina sp.]|uniref:pseudouridine synthase n=1 Tax=Planktomarina sp. TaxID=2024851 RepID=UPI00288E9D82|nr:pseudouridine synthase [Planktomarina sp.]MDT2030732.1 pseudouridine synthase [Planktomarina sp.]